MINFEDFHWHDAIIKNIIIDRNKPGIKDKIEIAITWPNNNETVNFIFEDVYWAKMNLNFGIIANETILQSHLLSDNDEDLINFYSKWNGLMNDVKLNVYEILLNSTGGSIKVIAKKFRLDKLL